MIARRFGVLALLMASAVASADQMPWAKDWDSATKLAGEQNKLIMVDFFTEW